VAIWTSSGADYAKEVAKNILENDYKLCFLWANERCTLRHNLQTFQYYWLKDLHKVKRKGYPLESVLAIDDSPEKHERNYGNLIKVSPFNGQLDDDELLLLMVYLEQLKHVPNVRKIDKRRWKQRSLLSDISQVVY
jgi:RNA polymerase II subunit A small phosphatase-like protein